MPQKTILVVDDEEKITAVIASYLTNAGYAVRTAFNGLDALRLYRKISPDLIILDLMLPDITGEEICRQIRNDSRVPILMLTAKVEERDLLKGFSLGTDDYLTKPFSPREVVVRVAALLRRTSGEPLCRKVQFNGDELSLDFNSHTVCKAGKELSLTPNEYKILQTFASHPGRVFSRSELISSAFGYNYEGYDRTIDTHIKNLRQKIEADFKHPVYIKTVHGMGYKFSGDTDAN